MKTLDTATRRMNARRVATHSATGLALAATLCLVGLCQERRYPEGGRSNRQRHGQDFRHLEPEGPG